MPTTSVVPSSEFVSARHLDLGTFPVGRDPVLDAHPVGSAHWAVLSAYMGRRFGFAPVTADGRKTLGAAWYLATPAPDVLVRVGVRSRKVLWCVEPMVPSSWSADGGGAVPDGAMPRVLAAFRATLDDLLEPCEVDGMRFDAVGDLATGTRRLPDGSVVQDADRVYPPHADCGWGVPRGMVGTEGWVDLTAALDVLGDGDARRAMPHVSAAMQEALLAVVPGEDDLTVALVMLVAVGPWTRSPPPRAPSSPLEPRIRSAASVAGALGREVPDAVAVYKDLCRRVREKDPSILDLPQSAVDRAVRYAAGFGMDTGPFLVGFEWVRSEARLASAVDDAPSAPGA